ncbi:TRAP transporter, 4TM/12TM fusion protein [Thermaerobacter marianensis DSM 12885]|uniref:TRAP transporter, 4TM/12TM fusion protein n=1 Tax=Thermaerobacter marianensis (strain ATCC 700841 / DSM 12885 / JCM 10246 / 7p75a) TaxID=644966 RepID=E6SJU9_THEM7|nr:TRAP transporter fused permease subunit [Thermaerobacter marianensis]ADU52182.1 TRAP transporter, 4TM/12TM fusion protein [Thermaerobacter marianensis DSM 12885]
MQAGRGEDVQRVHPSEAGVDAKGTETAATGSAAALDDVDELVERFEGATRRLAGPMAAIVRFLAVAMAIYHIWATFAYIPAHPMRAIHLGFGLALILLLYPASRRQDRSRVPWTDVVLAVVAALTMAYLVVFYREVAYRIIRPETADLVLGTVALLLVLEAARRTTGWVLPALAVFFLAYGFFGPYFPGMWGHGGYSFSRLIGQMYLSLEGIFGVPLGVSATFIILFTLYGALLDASGAGRFFVDLSLALTGRHRAGPGRAVTAASFLLGGPSGSGVATAVTLGAITWPLLRRAGYSPERAGALLSAGGIGAVISPPILGAASFIIAEILRVSYLDVIRWAVMPTVLYYLCILLMIELDTVRAGIRPVAAEAPPVGRLLRQYGFHLTSLVAIVAFLLAGYTAAYAVMWSMALAVAVSYLRRDTALTPRKLVDALDRGARSALSVVATTAVAGIIVGVLNLTGLGLKFSSLVLALSGGHLIPTLILAALVLLLLGLALPITASYIVAAVTVAPALVQAGVPEPAAHMFTFYYAVLSEVSPPTALSCFAVSAITGGNPFRTMWLTWRYALPAFLVPFLFTLSPTGMNLLWDGPWYGVLLASVTAVAGLTALVAGVSGWVRGPARWYERVLLVAGGLALMYPGSRGDVTGLALAALGLAAHLAVQRPRRPAAQA